MATKETTPEVEALLTPTEYFDMLKGKRQEADKESIQQMYDAACKLMRKYQVTGQRSGAQKLYKFAQVCEKELQAIEFGVTTYVNRKDLDEYISNIASKQVVIIELENYERDIPDELVDQISKFREHHIFDAYYVLFTDYTGGERKKVETARREKDPILFGAMMIGKQINSRLYYIGSWTDEYCDLTLDKMVAEFSKKNLNSPAIPITKEYPTYEEFCESFKESKKTDDDNSGKK